VQRGQGSAGPAAYHHDLQFIPSRSNK
jgi:hypothetical protein